MLLFLDRLMLWIRLAGGSMLLFRVANRGFGFVMLVVMLVAATSGRCTNSAKGRTFKQMQLKNASVLLSQYGSGVDIMRRERGQK